MQDKEKVTQNPNVPLSQENGQEQSLEKGTSTPLGKFANEQELAKAYRALEAEFTRRSQRLRELEKATEKGIKPESTKEYKAEDWEEKVSNLFAKYPIARTLSAEIEEYIKDNNEIIAQDDCLEYALVNVLSTSFADKAEQEREKSITQDQERIRKEIIAEYIASLNAQAPKVMPRGGEIPTAPPLKASTIKEAGLLAEKIFNS